MQSIDQLVLAQLSACLAAGKSAWLCTVVETFGASPRPLGSIMVVDSEGNITGSLSGGCIEDELLERLARGELATKAVQLLEYGISAEENERFGLPCGGRMQILLEYCDAEDVTRLADIQAICSALVSRRSIRRYVDLASGAWRLETLARAHRLALDEKQLRQDFGPRFQMLLIGANELARCVAEIATAMDYRVLVCDPREERRRDWGLDNVELLEEMPDDAVRQYACDRHSIVLTLTHDPRIDDMALMEALTHDLYYVGALGSKVTSEKRSTRLRQLDISAAQLAKLHAPVGLAIGSKSAMEIAVAIMAELITLRRKSSQ